MLLKTPRPLIAIAATVAFLLAAFGLLAALQQVVLVFFALVPLLAGIGILRKRVWSAYGFALFEVAQLAIIPLTLLHNGSIKTPTIVVTTALNLALALLFALAGKALARSGATRGSPLPWIVISGLVTVPFLFVQAFVIPSAGMANTLLVGDRILTRVFPRSQPADGNLVVFHFPPDRSQTYVKRVIGIPGDRIRIANKIVYRNGTALAEPYTVHKLNYTGDYRDNFPSDPSGVPLPAGSREMIGLRDMLRNHVEKGEVVVPAGHYFVLGDNRDNSLDSRYWGFLDSADIIGKPILIYDSEAAEAPKDAGAKTIFGKHRIRWGRLFTWF